MVPPASPPFVPPVAMIPPLGIFRCTLKHWTLLPSRLAKPPSRVPVSSFVLYGPAPVALVLVRPVFVTVASPYAFLALTPNVLELRAFGTMTRANPALGCRVHNLFT